MKRPLDIADAALHIQHAPVRRQWAGMQIVGGSERLNRPVIRLTGPKSRGELRHRQILPV